ncbi:hypothetical protein NGB58_26250, partial [Escherichia coli]|nr:hypothetical protein [Escherichia coli]
AVVSGAAMAAGWVQNGLGGTVEFSGELTPADHVTPWEVKTGEPRTGLDAFIKKGSKVADIKLDSAVPVLGIRTQSKDVFRGTQGITPQIDFGQSVDLGSFNGGHASLTLEVKNGEGGKIGTLTTKLSAGSEFSRTNAQWKDNKKYDLFAAASGDAFWGGLPKNKDGAARAAWSLVNSIEPEFVANYNDQGVESRSEIQSDRFIDTGTMFSAFYGSGITAGETLHIVLSEPVKADSGEIEWKASLPVVVSYM